MRLVQVDGHILGVAEKIAKDGATSRKFYNGAKLVVQTGIGPWRSTIRWSSSVGTAQEFAERLQATGRLALEFSADVMHPFEPPGASVSDYADMAEVDELDYDLGLSQTDTRTALDLVGSGLPVTSVALSLDIGSRVSWSPPEASGDGNAHVTLSSNRAEVAALAQVVAATLALDLRVYRQAIVDVATLALASAHGLIEDSFPSVSPGSTGRSQEF